MLIRLVLVIAILAPFPLFAADFSVSGWIPYWKVKEGTKEARENLSSLSEIMPFTYSVQQSGALKDLGNLKKKEWQKLFTEARKKDIQIIPTVMSGDGTLIASLLKDEKKRASHIAHIVKEVKKQKVDGIDIDYEGKPASIRPYFSLFLKELKVALSDKTLSCTIEARTPPKDLYRTVPNTIEYANDLEAINEHCDVVRIMAYDQQRADLTLNDTRKGEPYIPVADSAWVKKVIQYMARDIDKEKMILGIATYGAEWELLVAPDWFKSYGKLWALNPVYATDVADELDIKPYRNAAGELSFTYLPKNSPAHASKYKAPKGTPEGTVAAQKALAYANATGNNTLVYVVWWSDPEAIEEKIELAKELDIAGVSLFKIDGGTGKDTWARLNKQLVRN